MFLLGFLVGLPTGGTLGFIFLLFLQGASMLNRSEENKALAIPSLCSAVLDSEVLPQLSAVPSLSCSVTGSIALPLT